MLRDRARFAANANTRDTALMAITLFSFEVNIRIILDTEVINLHTILGLGHLVHRSLLRPSAMVGIRSIC
jgi:hypothetical protein